MEKTKSTTAYRLLRENVRALSPYSSARDEYVSDGSRMVFLDANENPFDNGLNRYPDPQQRLLKELVAEREGVNAGQILLGNGSDEVLDLLFRAFCEPGMDNIITLPPTYGMYKVLAGVNAVENREVALTESFQPDVEAILNKADARTKLLFLCSPNNPTANSMDAGLVKELLRKFEGIIVIDEAYIDFSGGDSWVGSLSEWPNLVVTQTLSKAYGMAAIRLGICYASTEIIGYLNKIKPPYNVNELTQRQAIKVIKDKSEVKKAINQIINEKNILMEQLSQIEYVRQIFPSDANFILVKVDDAGSRYRELLKEGIVVRNRSGQTRCENCLRLTVGTPEENRLLIKALKKNQ